MITKKVKKYAKEHGLDSSIKDVEKMIQKKIKSAQPTIDTFIKDVKKNVEKAGIDISKIEKSLQKTTKKKVTKKKAAKKKVAKKS